MKGRFFLIGMILIALALIGLMIFLGFLYFRNLNEMFLTKTFYLYFALGFLITALGFFFLFKNIEKKRTAKDLVIASLTDKHTSFLSNVRTYAHLILSTAIGIIYWPVGAIFGLSFKPWKTEHKKFSIYKYLDFAGSRTFEHWFSLYAFIILIIGYVLIHLGLQGRGYGRVFIYISIICAVLKLIDYFLHPSGITTNLRRLSKRPFLVFLTMLFFDFLTFIFAFTLINSKSITPEFSSEGVRTSINSLYKFQQVGILFEGQKLSFNEVLMGISGLMFYLTFIRNIFNIKEFKRDDEDLLWLIAKNIRQGKFKANLKLFKQIHKKTEISNYFEIVSLVGDNQLDRARGKLSQLRSDITTDEHHSLCVELFGLAILNNFNTTILLELIEEAIVYDLPDILMIDSIVLLSESEEFYQDAYKILDQFPDKYPLSLAELNLQLGKVEESLQLLHSLNNLGPIDSLMKSFLELKILFFVNPFYFTYKDFPSVFQFINNSLPSIENVYRVLKKKYEKLIFYSIIHATALIGELHREAFEVLLTGEQTCEAQMYHLNELKLKIKEEFADDEVAQLQFKSLDNRSLMIKHLTS